MERVLLVPVSWKEPGEKAAARVPVKEKPVKLVERVPVAVPETPAELISREPPPLVRLTGPREAVRSVTVRSRPSADLVKEKPAEMTSEPMVRVSV
jgi:hypothetical protein